MRRELFALHLPNPDRVRADFALLAELSRGLSGGDILNVCVNAIHAESADADPAKWLVTQAMLGRDIAKVKKAKVEHSGERGKSRRRIGFQLVRSTSLAANAFGRCLSHPLRTHSRM